MEYSLLSLQALPILLPMIVVAIIFNVGLYGHLNFKHIAIKKVSTIAALLMIPLAIFLPPLLVTMAFDIAVPLIKIQSLLVVVCFSLILMVKILKPKSVPSPLQVLGTVMFFYGAYSLLA